MYKYLLIIPCLTISLYAQSKDVTLLLPWKHQFQFAGYYMAIEKGFYKQEGFNVNIQEHNFNRDYIQEVSSGKYEFGVAHSALILKYFLSYNNLILLNAIHQSSPFALISLKYKDLNNLSGKKLMMNNLQINNAPINAMLQSQNIKKSDYVLVENNFNPLSLLTSQTDFMSVYLSNETFILKQKDLDYNIFHPKDYGYDFYSDILFTSKKMLEKNQDDVDKFRYASLKGWKYAYENIDETIEVILKYYNTQNKTKQALLYEANTLKKLAFVDNINFGEINPDRVKEIITTYRLMGLINDKSKLKSTEFIYNETNDLEFIFTKPNREYFQFIHNKYFKIMFIIIILIIVISFIYKVKTTKLLKQQEDRLNLKNEVFNTYICSSTTDTNGTILSVSDALCKITGYKREELISQNQNIFKDKETSQRVYKDLWITISSGHTWKGQLKNKKKDGSEYWIDIIISPIFDDTGNIIQYESIFSDISLEKLLENFNVELEYQVKEKTKELEKLAMTDKLTGLYNRDKIDKVLESNFNYFREFNENFSIIIIDIDHFKNVNDTFGHQVGDTILQEVSAQIKVNIRSTDFLGRWGGEEFLVICPSSDVNTIYNLAHKIRKGVEEFNFSRIDKLTICAGICDIKSTNNIEKMVSYADTALYDAKHTGRNNALKYEG